MTSVHNFHNHGLKRDACHLGVLSLDLKKNPVPLLKLRCLGVDQSVISESSSHFFILNYHQNSERPTVSRNQVHRHDNMWLSYVALSGSSMKPSTHCNTEVNVPLGFSVGFFRCVNCWENSTIQPRGQFCLLGTKTDLHKLLLVVEGVCTLHLVAERE